MATGTILKVVTERGFGFIAGTDGKEYFFHRGALVPPMDFGQLVGRERVEFDTESGPKGPRALRIRPA